MDTLNNYQIIDFTKYKLSEHKRTTFILSILNLYHKFKIKEIESLPIAVNFFDRYIINTPDFEKDDINAILCVCISLAIKSFDDIGYNNLIPALIKYFKIANCQIINKLEIDLLILFEWKVHPVLTIFDIFDEWTVEKPEINDIENLNAYILISLLLFKNYDLKIIAQAILSCNSNIVMITDSIIDCKIDLKFLHSKLINDE